MKGFIVMVALILAVSTLIAVGLYVSGAYSFQNMSSCFCSYFYETEEKITTYPFSDTGKLLVKNSNGSITITSHQHSTIILKEIKKGNKKDFQFIKTEINPESNSLSIKTLYDKKNINATVSYELVVPTSTILQDIQTSNGKIIVEGITSSVNTKTSNGKIYLTEVTGIIQAETSNGTIEVKNCTRIAKLKTSNGAITLHCEQMGSSPQGTIITTSNGAITFICDDFNEHNHFKLSTSNGAISLILPEKPSNYQSSDQLVGGRVSFTCGKATFVTETNVGSITINERSR